MKIIDLTPEYERHFLGRGDRREYEKAYPQLFDHYYCFWADRNIPPRTMEKPEIARRLRLIKNELPFIEEKFSKSSLDIGALKIALFVGQATSNGHAFKSGSEFVVWLPIETYHTALLVRVFLTHEIAHALHYSRSPEFYFEDMEKKRLLSRQLITEGLATYMTAGILGIDELAALWADFLPPDKANAWYEECARREVDIFRLLFDNFDSRDSGIGLFLASDPDNILRYRAGYYAGLKIVERIAKGENISLIELLAIPEDHFNKLAILQLRNKLTTA